MTLILSKGTLFALSALAGYRLPHLSDGNPLQFTASAVYQIDESTRYHHRAEHGSQDPQAQHNGKSLYRTRPERKQGDTCTQGSDVGIENGRPGTLVTCIYRSLRRHALSQFVAYTFINQHVGVDRHPQGKSNGCHSGRRQG